MSKTKTAATEKVTIKEKASGFISSVVDEMKRVTWPTRDELKESTIIVIVLCLVLAVFTYVIDIGVSAIIEKVF